MKQKTSSSFAITIGIDLGDGKHAVCVLDAKGEILKQESIANNRGSLTALSRRYPGALLATAISRQNELGLDPAAARVQTHRKCKNSSSSLYAYSACNLCCAVRTHPE